MKPQLTIRDLFWLVLMCGLALAWWMNRGQWIAMVKQHDRVAIFFLTGLNDFGFGSANGTALKLNLRSLKICGSGSRREA